MPQWKTITSCLVWLRAVGSSAPVYLPHVENGHGDDWLRTDDRTPNAQGCERLGIHAVSADDLKARLTSGEVDPSLRYGRRPL